MEPKSLLQELCQEVCQVLPAEGRVQDVVPKVNITRFDAPHSSRNCFYKPVLAMVLKGQKHSVIAGRIANYGTGQCAVVCVDLPGVYQVDEASSAEPFLAISVDLDRKIISDLITEFPDLIKESNSDGEAVEVFETQDEILDVVLRMLKLRHKSTESAFYAPMYRRELHYLLLKGPQRQALSAFCSGIGEKSRVGLAISWLRKHFNEPLDIDTLAQKASMATSTFHRHFKLVTTLSPIQFQKRLRLQEAERLMVSEGLSVDRASLMVGYESASQFSREYKRLFGLAPRDDVNKKKSLLAV